MNLEKYRLLKNFCDDLEDKDIICSECADALRANIHLSTIDTSNPYRDGNVKLHVRCTSRIIEAWRIDVEIIQRF